MSRLAKSSVLTALLVPLALGGCKPKKGTANPEDYYPLIQIAFGGGETAAMIGRNEAIKAENFGGCIASEVLIAAFDSAGQILQGKITDSPVIPGFDIDVSACLPFHKKAPEADMASLQPVLVAAYVGPAEEASTEEGEATEEPSPTEPEEPPVEEPEAEEEAAESDEEPTSLKGNEDAAVLVESIAGMALIPAMHYANKLKASNCRKGTLALSAVHYVNSMIKPIADEIASPDGKISVPAQPVDLSECKEG